MIDAKSPKEKLVKAARVFFQTIAYNTAKNNDGIIIF